MQVQYDLLELDVSTIADRARFIQALSVLYEASAHLRDHAPPHQPQSADLLYGIYQSRDMWETRVLAKQRARGWVVRKVMKEFDELGPPVPASERLSAARFLLKLS
jgi:hypothetical protein